MKKYKFIVRKVEETDVEIIAENNREAYQKVIELLSIGVQILFKNVNENNKIYEIKMCENSNQRLENNKDNSKKIVDKIIKQLEKDAENYEENETEVEDDLPVEIEQIVCEKCGNCISLDEIL